MQKQNGWRHIAVVIAALGVAALACEPSTRADPTVVPPIVQSGGDEDTTTGADTQPVSDTSASDPTVRGRANMVANIREKPGADCTIIGTVPVNMEIDLLIRTDSPNQHWYQTNYLGANNPGWVYHQPLTVLSDDSGLPRVPEEVCAAPAVAPSCGDNICNGDETCATCTADCGACPIPEGACQLGAGNCCGDGVCQTDETADWCGDCEEVEELATCGNGVVDPPAEDCEPPGSSCGMAIVPGTCSPTCVCIIPEIDDDFIPPGPTLCGNGSCTVGENSCNCPDDCPGLCVAGDFNPLEPAQPLDPCVFDPSSCLPVKP